MQNGVRIFELKPQELHAKTLVVDGVYSTVGSFNMDTLSFKVDADEDCHVGYFLTCKHLLEVNLSFFDREVSNIIESQFQTDLKLCEEVTLKKWEDRYALYLLDILELTYQFVVP